MSLPVIQGRLGVERARPVRASCGRKSRHVKIVELDAAQSRPVLRAFAVKVPVGVGFAKRAGLVRDGAPDEFAALAGQLNVFRFDPDPAGGT